MKVRLTVTVDIDDPGIYPYDEAGLPNGPAEDEIDREHVGEYVLDAVRWMGGSHAAASPFTPRNIRSVRVQGLMNGEKFDMIKERET